MRIHLRLIKNMQKYKDNTRPEIQKYTKSTLESHLLIMIIYIHILQTKYLYHVARIVNLFDLYEVFYIFVLCIFIIYCSNIFPLSLILTN